MLSNLIKFTVYLSNICIYNNYLSIYSISIISGQVTWLRTMDSTVLSVGADTFSSDTRLAVVHVARSVHSVSGHTWIFPHPVTRGQISTQSHDT